MNRARPRLNFQAMSQLAELADYAIPFALRAVCRLGVADHLTDEPRPLDELAAACGAHAPSLLRVLRTLVTREVFYEPRSGQFVLAPMGALLRSDHPLSMRWAFRLGPDVDALAALTDCVRSGEPAVPRLFGTDYLGHLEKHPELIREFHASQQAHTRIEELTVLRSYPWRELDDIVDIGSGNGVFLARLLQTHAQMRGILLDLPHMVAAAHQVLADAGVAERCEIVAHDFHRGELPRAASAYVIKRVLASQDDAQAAALLADVRAAMRPDSRLLLLEPLLPDPVGYAMDMLMLAVGRGRVRTVEEVEALLRAADLRVERWVSMQVLPFVDARPA